MATWFVLLRFGAGFGVHMLQMNVHGKYTRDKYRPAVDGGQPQERLC